MTEIAYQQNKKKAKQTIILYAKLLNLQESCWGKLFLFQKTQCFQSFNKIFRLKGQSQIQFRQLRCYIKDVLEFRLDDIIYLLLLLAMMLIFNSIASNGSHPLFKAYKIFCILLFISSMLCLFIKSSAKYVFIFFAGLFIPISMYAVYSNLISLDPAESLELYYYLGYESLILVFIFSVIVYPLKKIIQTKIGSLYSYLYGLSVITLLGLWPFYSIAQELISSGSITLSIIYNNKSLVVSFIVIIVFSFYLIVHNTFFEGDKQDLFVLLKKLFTSQQISRAIEEMENKQIKQYEWHNVQIRIMSFFVLATTLGLQIFIFMNMSNNSYSMAKSLPLMVFTILFLLIGTFYVIIPVKNKIIIPIFTVLSLIPAPLSFFYSKSFLYWEYICTVFSLPYIVLFWTIIKCIDEYKPLLKNKAFTVMYCFIHTPIMIFVMDVLNYFNSNGNIGTVGYVSIGIVIATILIAVVLSIVFFCIDFCSRQTQVIKNTTQLDFNYEEKIVNYKPYKKLNTFTLQWLSQLNLIDVGVFLNCFFYLTSNTIAFYSLNQLIYNYTESYFFSKTIYNVVQSQFFILLVFMLYCHYFMSTNNDNWDFWMLASWLITGLVFIILSYILPIIPDTFRLFGAFCLVMFVVSIGFQYIKDSNKKIIPFVAPVLVIFLWITIIIPYVIVIPTASIYTNQSSFGYFIYNCILVSALLLIAIVGVVSMIFNILMNKFQEQRRYKYVIQDVKSFFDQQGIESNDQILHVFHESYQSRDKKYIFFLKNGYPINVVKQQDNQNYKLITYDNYVNKRTTQILPKKKQDTVDCCWSCLTFLCGQDDEQRNNKIKKALQNNLLNEQQAQQLFPQQRLSKLNRMNDPKMYQNKKQKIVRIKPEDVNSTKSLLLSSLNQGPRRLGPQYTILKLQKQKRLALQIWDSVFQLISNPDKGERMIIFNDFRKFCQISKFQMDQKTCQQLFNKYAKSSWGDTVCMNYEQFSTALEQVAYNFYQDRVPNEKQRIMTLLVDKVYFNMARFEQFNDMRKNYKSENFDMVKSGFLGSLQRYKQVQKQKQKQTQNLVRFYKKQKNHLDEPKKQYQSDYNKKNKNVKSTQQIQQNNLQSKSCKRSIYDCYTSVRDSCSHVVPVEQVKTVKKQRIKPWSYLASEAAKILHRKQTLWQDQHQVKQYQFRLILNNIFMAMFKFLDLYGYIIIILNDPQVKWYDSAKFSYLYVGYRYQLYFCFAIAFVTVPLGLKGISFISQDRLGLTQARVPAGFPHPMFFYTMIYKLLVLSLFGIISSTFLVTFGCNWTQSVPYKLYQDSSLECLSTQHNIYIILSLISLIVYFPLSSYTFPNFQFSQKRLDLKFRPSYLVLYFQVNFILIANNVLLAPAGKDSTVQIAYISINIVSLFFLSVVCLKMKPCLIQWFNWIQFLTIFIGLIWNVGGLVLYLTKLWTLSIILSGGFTVAAILVVVFIIRRRYFSNAAINVQNDEDEMIQLQMGRKYKKSKNKQIIAQNEMGRSSINLQKIDNYVKKSTRQKQKKKDDKQLIIVEDVNQNTEGAESNTARSSGNQLFQK